MTTTLIAGLHTAAVRSGLLLPEQVLWSPAFQVLATFVALNTLMYVALAVLKVLPKIYPGSWFGGRNRRAEDRSIYPAPDDREH